jgi:HAD superfamily hydrolase (TIGR01549 family)
MSLELERVKALCFDLDGTLRNTDDMYVAWLSGWLRPFQAIMPDQNPEKFARRLVMKVERPGYFFFHILDRLHLDQYFVRTISRIRQHLRPDASKHHMIIPGVAEMLQDLRQHYPLAIVSIRDHPGTLSFLEHNQLTSYFKTIITGGSSTYTKPFPDPLLLAASELGVPTTNLLMIGDTATDIKAGKAVGAQTVGVLCGFGTRKDLTIAGADLILESPSQLRKYLLRDSINLV